MVVGLLVACALAVLKGLLWTGGIWSAEVFGYASTGLFLPTLFSYLFAGRRTNRNPVRFTLIFLSISVFMFLVGLAYWHPSAEAEVANLVREVTGHAPVDKSRDADPGHALLREVIQEFYGEAKAHNQKLDDLQADLRTLYTPPSYSEPAAMQHSLEVVQKMAALDHDFLSQVDAWPSKVQEIVRKSQLSEAEQLKFLNGFEESFLNSDILSLRRRGDEIESRWCDANTALYTFALAHAKQIRVQNKRAFIDNEKVRKEFTVLQQNALDRRQELRELNTQLAQLQSTSLQQYGLSRNDLNPTSATSKPQPNPEERSSAAPAR